MGKYTRLAEQIVELVGGKANIASVTHCATRLRFKLADESVVQDEALEALDGVVAVRKSAGQYQVVIGAHVEEVYNDLLEVTGIVGDGAVEDDEDVPGEKRAVGAILLDFISSMMGPLLSVICGAGVLKGIVSIISVTGLLASTDALYMVLNAAGDATYYFLPILLGYTIAKKLKVSPVIGMVLGAIFVYPDVQNMENAFIFGIDVSGIAYKQSMLPIVLAMLVAAPIDRWLKRIIPQPVSFLESTILFLIMAPLSFTVIGPVMMVVADLIAAAVQAALGVSPVLAGILVCALWQVLVLFGVHVVLASVIFTLMFATGSSMLYPLTCIPGFAVFGVSLAIYLRSREQKTKEIALPATLSAFFGITEPAMYGLLLPNIKYFVITCVVSGIAGALMGILKVTAYQLGGSGLMCLLIAVNGNDFSGVINFAIAIAFAAVAGFALTMLLFRQKKTEAATAAAE